MLRATCFWVMVVSAITESSLPQQLRTIEDARLRARHMGSKHAGWTFDVSRLRENSIVYSFGLGGDISWDLELIRTVRCDVHGFDNTPQSNAYLEKEQSAGRLPPKFHWHRYLLGAQNGMMKLSLPTGHMGSYASDAGSARGFRYGSQIRVEAKSIGSIMQMLNHSRIDMVKMDIEATEFVIFNQILEHLVSTAPAVHGFPACQLLLEFHSRLSPRGYEAKADTLLVLQSLGFTLIRNSIKPDGADDALFINPRFCTGPQKSSAPPQKSSGVPGGVHWLFG